MKDFRDLLKDLEHKQMLEREQVIVDNIPEDLKKSVNSTESMEGKAREVSKPEKMEDLSMEQVLKEAGMSRESMVLKLEDDKPFNSVMNMPYSSPPYSEPEKSVTDTPSTPVANWGVDLIPQPVSPDISDGSTASYYELPSSASELQHLISHKDMNAQIGEIFRACYRYGQVSHSGKLRDAKKIKFYAEAEIARLEDNRK